MFVKYNPNPYKSRVGDCVVRAISTALDREWEQVYMELAYKGLEMGDMPSSNAVWGTYLYEEGLDVKVFPFGKYTVKSFAKTHPRGTFVLGTGSHLVAVIDGNYYDTWDSGSEPIIYCFIKEE